MMNWTAMERAALERLLRRAQTVPLTPDELRDLRPLLLKANPSAVILLDEDLVRASMIAYGAQVAFEMLTKSAPASA